MTPYYDDGRVALYHGDCREVLPGLPPGSADLLVTDPPYGVDWHSRLRHDPDQFAPMAGDDGTFDVIAALALALKILRPGRHVYVFGPADLSTLPLASPVELIWDKERVGLGDLALPWGPSHEPITFAVYHSSPANRAKGLGRLAARLRRQSVIRCRRTHGTRGDLHPAEKPVPLLRQLIESSSLLDETVLDPFAGGGSTLEAAKREGRRAVGIEIEERYCEVAANRLRDVVWQEG